MCCLTEVHLPFILSLPKIRPIRRRRSDVNWHGLVVLSIGNRFSLDELITKLADVYERKAFAELLKMILQMVQEILIHRLLHGRLDTLKYYDHGYLRF